MKAACAVLAEYRLARDPADTAALDWREVPETIAVLPRLTSGGVQAAYSGVERTAAEESQPARHGGAKAENDFLWRNAA